MDTAVQTSDAPRRYVLLGCGGFIGSHLVDRLLSEDGVSVEGVDPRTDKIAGHLDRANYVHHAAYIDDLDRSGDLERAIAGADVVINLAAICNPSEYNTRPLATIQANFLDVLPILNHCARHRVWLVHYSTSEVYGRTVASYLPGAAYDDPDLFEQREDETPLVMGPIRNQRWSYATAKQLVERFIYALHQERGLPYTIIRPFNFFGPRMDFIPGRDGEGVPRVLACFMAALLDNKPMRLVDGGTARRTIVSIHDAIDALMLMLQRPAAARNRIFNIGHRGNEVTMAELAARMRALYAEISGEPGYLAHPIETVSSLEFYGEGYEDCDRRVPDLSKAETLLGWRPKRSLDETLRETIAYYHDAYGPAARVAAAE